MSNDGTGILVFLILGAIVGYIASQVMRRNEGFFGSLAVGVVGAFLGAFIFHLFRADQPILAINVGSILAAFIGSLVVAGALNYVQGRRIRP